MEYGSAAWIHTRIAPVIRRTRRQLCAALRRALPHLAWRWHGIGCLQAYLREGSDYETRVHIWHPSLVRPGIKEQGDAHSHRFRLESTVLCGSIVHMEYQDQGDNGLGERYDHFVVDHARTGNHFTMVDTGVTSIYRKFAADIPAGLTYTFAKGAFHRSSAQALTVTIVNKLRQSNTQARILVKHGAKPVPAFQPDDKIDMRPYIKEATTKLFGASA